MRAKPDLPRRLTAEAVGTALLLAAVVGSGIMGERLSGGNVAIALLANSMATGSALVALIAAFGPVSGGHFNPAVTAFTAVQGGLGWSEAIAYMAVQFAAAVGGVFAAHVMFAEDVVVVSQQVRAGFPQAFSEAVATFGLLCTIWGCARQRAPLVPVAVGAYITGRLLVHGVHVVRQPGCHRSPHPDQYLCWHSACRRSAIRHCAIARGGTRDDAISMA